MFGIGFLELCIICVAALVLVGPQKLPHVMRELGKFLVQMRRMTNEVKHSVQEATQELDDQIKQSKEEILEPIDSVKAVTNKFSKNNLLFICSSFCYTLN